MKSGTRLERVLAAGGFAVTAELGPPRSVDPDSVRRKAELLAPHVDAVNITDNQAATVRMSSLAACVLALGAGAEPVLQITCRDRNRLAIQADLLGAAGLGIGNVLCLTGDHVRFGDHPQARSVFDLDSIQLVALARRLCDEGLFAGGQPVRNGPKAPLRPPRLFIGAAANPFADPLGFRTLRLAKKVAAGADFIQTQAVFDLARFAEWLERARDAGLTERTAILAGITPIRSLAALRHMRANVPGIRIPDELARRLEGAADPAEEGIRIAVEQIRAVRALPGVRGVHLMAIMWESVVPRITAEAGLAPRPAAAEEAPDGAARSPAGGAGESPGEAR